MLPKSQDCARCVHCYCNVAASRPFQAPQQTELEKCVSVCIITHRNTCICFQILLYVLKSMNLTPMSSIPILNRRVHSKFLPFHICDFFLWPLSLCIFTYLITSPVCKKSPMPSLSHLIVYVLLTLLGSDSPAST